MHPSDSDPSGRGPPAAQDDAAVTATGNGAPSAAPAPSKGGDDDDIIIRARDVTVTFGTKNCPVTSQTTTKITCTGRRWDRRGMYPKR